MISYFPKYLCKVTDVVHGEDLLRRHLTFPLIPPAGGHGEEQLTISSYCSEMRNIILSLYNGHCHCQSTRAPDITAPAVRKTIGRVGAASFRKLGHNRTGPVSVTPLTASL